MLCYLYNVKALKLARHHKPLTNLADKFRALAKNNLTWFVRYVYTQTKVKQQ